MRCYVEGEKRSFLVAVGETDNVIFLNLCSERVFFRLPLTGVATADDLPLHQPFLCTLFNLLLGLLLISPDSSISFFCRHIHAPSPRGTCPNLLNLASLILNFVT